MRVVSAKDDANRRDKEARRAEEARMRGEAGGQSGKGAELEGHADLYRRMHVHAPNYLNSDLETLRSSGTASKLDIIASCCAIAVFTPTTSSVTTPTLPDA